MWLCGYVGDLYLWSSYRILYQMILIWAPAWASKVCPRCPVYSSLQEFTAVYSSLQEFTGLAWNHTVRHAVAVQELQLMCNQDLPGQQIRPTPARACRAADHYQNIESFAQKPPFLFRIRYSNKHVLFACIGKISWHWMLEITFCLWILHCIGRGTNRK